MQIEIRTEQLLTVIADMTAAAVSAAGLSARTPSSWQPPPATRVRRGCAVDAPALTEVTEASAQTGAGLPSARHDGDTPSVRLQPAALEAKRGTSAEQVQLQSLSLPAERRLLCRLLLRVR